MSELEERPRRPARKCACGCGEFLDAQASERAKYRPGHRQRAYARRLRERAREVGAPASLSLETLDSMGRTSERKNDADSAGGSARGASRGRRRGPLPGVRVYFPSVELLANLLDRLDPKCGPEDVDPLLEAEAVEILEAALERRHVRD